MIIYKKYCKKQGPKTNAKCLRVWLRRTLRSYPAPFSPPASPPTRDCVHIKGLSQNVTENDIVNFLSGYQSSLIWTHIHYNPKRKCNGSAYVQMCNSDEAIRCSNECNQKFFTDW